MCPRVVGELAGVIARLLLIILEMPGQTRSSLKVGKRPTLPPFSIWARRSMQGTAGWSATSESLAGGWSKFISLIPWPTSVSSCCLRCPGVAEVPICCSETGPRTSGSPSGAFAGHQEKYLQTPPLRQLLSLHRLQRELETTWFDIDICTEVSDVGGDQSPAFLHLRRSHSSSTLEGMKRECS